MSIQNENQTASIQQTVEQLLQASGQGYYLSYAGPAIAALDERERILTGKLVDYAVDQGADESEIKAYLREMGMAVEADEPEVEDEDEDEESKDTGAMGRIEQMLTSLTGQVDSLTEFARRNGYRS